MALAASLTNPATATSWLLEQTTTIIGRADDADVRIDAAAVSRRHATIERTPHGYLLYDNDSSNGTWINGVRVEEAHPLRDDDEIVVGGIETLRFVDPLATPMAPAIGRLTGVWIDPESGAVWVDAQPVEPPLSERQQALLELLASNEDALVSRESIVDIVWADVAAEGVSAEAVDALVKRLKARLRPLQLHGDYLEVRRGRGIRLRSS